ncbi:MAG: UDP-3-O-acyl-N-acetylglucosamine deacetylase, partial [Geovibrio sp.]|nr:UDP-3-O-acyl-N-acetylglucosamine deacetylase [Geovibrio sp.]
MFQTTLNNRITFEGIGLHSGETIQVVVNPSYSETGVMFRRADIQGSSYTKASPYTVTSTQLATSINCGKGSISTIEHLMGALYGLGVDNALVDVYGTEVPILDGSAYPFVGMIREAGVKELNIKRKYLKFKKKIIIEKGDKWIELIPSRFPSPPFSGPRLGRRICPLAIKTPSTRPSVAVKSACSTAGSIVM